jgi:hypothetical protein
VNGDALPRACTNADGSVDVWVRGRRLHFPGAGRQPTVTEEQAPADAGDLPADVRIDLGDVVTMVSRDGWYVRLGADTVDVNRTRARRSVIRIFSRRPGNG